VAGVGRREQLGGPTMGSKPHTHTSTGSPGMEVLRGSSISSGRQHLVRVRVRVRVGPRVMG